MTNRPNPLSLRPTGGRRAAVPDRDLYGTADRGGGLGGYQFGDYARLGAPLTLVVIIAIAIFVPMFRSF